MRSVPPVFMAEAVEVAVGVLLVTVGLGMMTVEVVAGGAVGVVTGAVVLVVVAHPVTSMMRTSKIATGTNTFFMITPFNIFTIF